MDPDIRAQELIRCDLCETEMVQFYCDTCHVKLCNACIGEHMTSDESKKKHLGNKCEGLLVAITKHGEEWHREIDKVVTKLIAQVEELKTDQLQILQRYLDEMNEKTSEIRNEINSVEVVIDSQEISKLFNITSNIHTYKNLPEKPVQLLPKFTPVTIQGEKLCSLFGSILPCEITSERHGYSIEQTQRSSETGFSPPVKQLLDEPEIITTINTKYESNLHNVACLSDEEIWTCGYDSSMKLFSINQGSELQAITTKSGNPPSDIAVTEQGYLVYTDPSDRTVNIVKNEEIETMITSENWIPCNICNTSSGDLLVVMESDMYEQSKIVRYCGSTEIKQTIQFDEEGIPFYSYGYVKCISENKNLDICVADYSARAVVVVNNAGELNFMYTGPKYQLFKPRGITTDSQSHILIADLYNDFLHILDQYGHIVRYIDCRLKEPRGLCVDTNNNLFVAQKKTTQVKKIKYLQ
ncbi:uncharacterized protein LOC133192967 [Saccostrea echinata]|uniref:uncharacterized protein LOC133192967 n=1 Tax=Saccostrea echinata TaxID=191078 RepID=UPI002A810CE0|nr:uncharacterized protein LOC133192967 [Saccostrea echinata]